MSAPARHWSTHQLAEFLATLSTCRDEATAGRRAVERAAETLEAEAGALVSAGGVQASIGFPPGEAPEADLVAVAAGAADRIAVPGVGSCPAVTVPLADGGQGALVLARAEPARFEAEEMSLLRGIGRVLGMSLETLRTLEAERELRADADRQAEENAVLLASLRERQDLLERLAEIQRLIVERRPVHAVLDAIAVAARDLVGGDPAGLRLLPRPGDGETLLVASSGMSPELAADSHRVAADKGASGRAMRDRRLVIIDDYEGPGRVGSHLLRTAMAAPVYEEGETIGALVSASHDAARSYRPAEREALSALAEHASIALTDAKTVADAMHQAYHDALTGLPNRTLFLDRLQQALARSGRSGRPPAVLFLDLDSFKRVNDSLGHAAGDSLLVAVGRRLNERLRPADSAARFGGDEFAVLLENANEREAVNVAGRILAFLKEPFTLGDREVMVEASVGIALGDDEPAEILRNADLAMYRAKHQGKGRCAVYEPGLHAAMVDRLELEVDLQRALEQDDLALEYQPIVDLRSGEVLAVEALARWRHPTRGMVPPPQFVALAEESQLILALGRWVLERACADAAGWPGQGGAPVALAVNLSARQLQHPGLVDEIARVLAATGLAPGRLVLEITETMLMQDVEETILRLQALKDLGVTLAVDDFGTGYSSLQYLRRFPIDILKIAKSFVDGVATATDGLALARAIVDMADSFGLQVVAEGIELPEQVERLVELGCTMGQGYHFARPMGAASIHTLLAGGRRVSSSA